MTRKALKFSVAVVSLLAAAMLVSGCGTSNKEGTSTGVVAKVDEASCAQCHGSAREKLTGREIYVDYAASVHALNSVGCQDCHGGGAQHFGVGPIPFPKPGAEQCKVCHDSEKLVTNYQASKHFSGPLENEEGQPCQRCHTHQGAVLASMFGFTGDGDVMAAMVNAPGLIANPEPIKCTTCHVTHKPQELRVDAAWLPSVTVGSASSVAGSGNDQYRLCTQCHTYINPAGKVAGSGTAASGTVKVGHHETSWYRAIATTHYDNLATPEIEGYNIRTTGSDPCFDCHNHEAKTNTNNDPSLSSFKPANTTIYTDWAQSGHALDLLGSKFAAVRANPVSSTLPRTDPVRVAQGLAQVDAVMAANVPAGPFGGHNTGSCARCHTTEGFAYYMDNKANIPVAAAAGVLKCNGCHVNAGTGELRILKGTKANTNYTTDLGWDPSAAFAANGTAYTLNYGKKAYPDVAASNLCISCHDSREKDPGAITAASTTYNRTHYMQAAATMYVKMGFLNLSTGTSGTTASYLASLMSDQDGGTITSTHRKLGTPAIIGDGHTDKNGVATFVGYPATGPLATNGPCVACHLVGSHTLKIDQKAITAVCNKCHSAEGGNDITTIAAFNQHFIEPQAEVYQNALQLAIDTFNAKNTGITLAPEEAGSTYVRAYATSTLVSGAAVTTSREPNATEWTAAAVGVYVNKTKLLGAVSNVVFLKREPAAYAHARTYSRRLAYDTIDYLDDGVLNMSVSVTAHANNALRFGKGAKAFTTSATVGDLAPGTTESMLFLLAYNRTTGAWTAIERP